MSALTLPYTAISGNVEDGGLGTPIPGQVWDRERLDLWIEFLRRQRLQAEQDGAPLLFAAQREAKYYRMNGRAIWHEIERASGLRGIVSHGARHDLNLALWINPERVAVVADWPYAGHPFWIGAQRVDLLIDGRVRLTVLNAHLNLASAPGRLIETAGVSALGDRQPGFVLIDGNSGQAEGQQEDLDERDPVHRMHRAASPQDPSAPDTGPADYLTGQGWVEIHAHVNSPASLRPTAGHRRPGQGGSWPDHDYAHPALTDGRLGRITQATVITTREYPGADAMSDHHLTVWRGELTGQQPDRG